MRGRRPRAAHLGFAGILPSARRRFSEGAHPGARTPRCAWRSSVCAPDDNPREPDRSRSLAPIAHTHGPRDRSAARRPRCAEHAAAGAFGASAHMRRGRNGHRPCPSAVSIGRVHRPCPSAVSIGRVHRPCPSAVSIGRVHRRPRRGPKKKRRPQDAVHCMRPQCPPDDARQAATRPQARAERSRGRPGRAAIRSSRHDDSRGIATRPGRAAAVA